MNWESPQSLLWSNVKNVAVKNPHPRHRHLFGHIIVELKDSSHYAIMGIVPKSRDRMAFRVYEMGYGLGIFFSILPGKLEEGTSNLDEITSRYGTGDVAFMKFSISEGAFNRLWTYAAEYKKRGYDKLYNGENKPREGKGAGCSAFGVSFLYLAGVKDTTETDAWKINVNVPMSLVGGPAGEHRWVGMPRILLRDTWADTLYEAYKPLQYFEPTLMYEWIHREWDLAGKGKSDATAEIRGTAKGIVKDCRKVPVPEEPIWLNKPQ